VRSQRHTQRQVQVGGCGRGRQQGLGGGQQGAQGWINAQPRLLSTLTPQQSVLLTPPRMQLTPWQMSPIPLSQHARRPQQPG